MMSLSKKVAIITGASSGIGAAIAEKFAAEGARVAIVGRNQSKLSAVEQRIRKTGAEVLPIIADVSKEEDAQRIINDTIKKFGTLDILVNNAGISRSAGITAPEAMKLFDEVMSTNFRSAVYLTHLAAPHLIKSQGNIINISSVAALSTLGDTYFIYCSSKAALDHFSRCVARELAQHKVRVNTINPGPVRSDILANAGLEQNLIEATWEISKKMSPLDRISDTEEVADLAVFIASDKGRGITGSSFVMDNGFLLKGSN